MAKISKSKKENKLIMNTNLLTKCLIVVAIVIACAGGYLGFKIYQQTSGFDASRLTTNESSVIYTVGDEEAFHHYGESGITKNVSYDDIPQVLIDAVISAEDSRYFEHNGFDLPRIVKAFLGNLAAGKITGGGSTITQQLIKKSYYPNEEKTIERKVGEVLLSIQATKEVTKQKVLELYLNKIYFGRSNKTIGIYAASKYYFDKDVQNLTLPEAALLAGTLNSPSAYDPFYNLDKAQKRRNIVLDLMCNHGYITEEERDNAKAVPVQNTLKSNPLKSGGIYQAYVDMVTREVYAETGYDPNYTNMKIYTYMDKNLQETLYNISVENDYKFCDDYIQAGAIVQDVQNGRVVGVLSARDYEAMGTTYAYAADKERIAKGELSSYGQRNQPGSSLKPIISYASAFEFLNYSDAHIVHDIPYSSAGWTPKNWNGTYQGDVTIYEALFQSWNLAAINTLNEVLAETGKDKMLEYMEGFGFDMYDEQDFHVGYSIGGWNTGVSAQESANAYATIANGGTYYKSHCVEKIEILETGEVIYLDKVAEENKKQTISEETAFMIRDVMTDYVKTGGGQYSRYNIGYQIGAKSGTSNHSNNDNEVVNSALKGKSKDSWMIGFSPDYSWAVWCGYAPDDQRAGRYLKDSSDSKNIAAIIAKTVHKDGLKNSYKEVPETLKEIKIVSGIYPYVLPGEGVPKERIITGWFNEDNKPSTTLNGGTLNNLNSFTATVTGSKINVQFTEYDPITMTQSSTPTKQYGNYTLPYLGDANQVYGKVVYAVDVKDSSGNIVHSEKLNTNIGTLNFNAVGNSYTVTGYYAYETGTTTSNKIDVTVQGTAPISTSSSCSVTTKTNNSITVKASPGMGSTISIDLLDTNNYLIKNHTVTSTSTFSFGSLTPNTLYKVKAYETNVLGTRKQILDTEVITAQ